MSDSQEQGSEVARLLQQIREEYTAAKLGMSGVAYGTSKHEFITKRMENIGNIQNELETIMGKDLSMALVLEQMDACPDVKRSSVQ